MVDFCEKCGSLILGKVGQDISCPNCGVQVKVNFNTEPKLNLKKDEIKEVINKDKKEFETDPLTDVECPKCGHSKARFFTKQTRASDEPETQFFKCEKCAYKWRDYK